MINRILFVIFGAILMLDAQGMEYKKPEFTLNIIITGVGADIRLNDISIEFEAYSGHSTMTYDVNQSVIAGLNELKVITFPFLGKTAAEGQTKNYHPEAEVKVSLYVSEKNDDSNKILLSQIHIKPGLPLDQATNSSARINGLGNVILDDKHQPLSFPAITPKQQITATRKTLMVQKNYPRWAWQDGQTIENTRANHDSLLAAYQEIYEAYKTADRKKLFELHNATASEYALAYSLPGGTAEGHSFIETAELLDNPDAELDEFITDGTKLDIFANGKMARIVDIAQYHPITFVHKSLDLIYTLKFGFYKNKDNKWIMIR